MPNVNSNPANQTVYVNWNRSENANPNLCARSEVTAQQGVLKNSFCVKKCMQNNKQVVGARELPALPELPFGGGLTRSGNSTAIN